MKPINVSDEAFFVADAKLDLCPIIYGYAAGVKPASKSC